jgi:hypothetical protein
MDVKLRLTKAEVAALQRRATHYRSERGRLVVEDRGPTIDWSNGVRKSKARLSAERKILDALEESARG